MIYTHVVGWFQAHPHYLLWGLIPLAALLYAIVRYLRREPDYDDEWEDWKVTDEHQDGPDHRPGDDPDYARRRLHVDAGTVLQWGSLRPHTDTDRLPVRLAPVSYDEWEALDPDQAADQLIAEWHDAPAERTVPADVWDEWWAGLDGLDRECFLVRRLVETEAVAWAELVAETRERCPLAVAA